jgi:hypothetical protein
MSTHIASQDSKPVDPAKVIATTSQAVQKLFQEGVAVPDFQAVVNDKVYREQLASFMIRRGVDPDPPFPAENVDQARARAIMGQNIIGLADVYHVFQEPFTKEQLDALENIPFSVETLVQYMHTHVLVADLGYSVNALAEKLPVAFGKKRDKPLEYSDMSAMCCESSVRWRLVRKNPDKNRYWWMSRLEQISRSPRGENVPTIRTLSYFVAMMHASQNVLLTRDVCLRSRDVFKGGHWRKGTGFFLMKKRTDFHSAVAPSPDNPAMESPNFSVITEVCLDGLSDLEWQEEKTQ